MRGNALHVGICLLLLLCLAAPAGAVVLVIPYRGTVTSLDPGTGTVGLEADGTYVCSYQGPERACFWSPITPLPVKGTARGRDIGSIISVGDRVEASIAGGEGGPWVAIGRLGRENGKDVLWAVTGDLSELSTPLAGRYLVRYRIVPDCTKCSGTICQALHASVVMSRDGKDLLEKSLATGESGEYADQGDGSSVSVTFLGGTASSFSCGAGPGMAGPQPFSTFTVEVKTGIRPGITGTPGLPSASPATPGSPGETITPAGTASPPAELPTGLFVTPGGIIVAVYLTTRLRRF